MKEITFLKQNSEKWEEYETSLDKKELENPAKVAEMFVELTDDFSYAKSNYKESKTTKYLNGLTAQVHQLVYKNKAKKEPNMIKLYNANKPAPKEKNKPAATIINDTLILFIVI